MKVLGVDASNIRSGGGLTHLGQMLGAASPLDAGFDRVVVWGGADTLAAIQVRPWMDLRHVPALDRPMPCRVWWQQRSLVQEARRSGCSVLLSPGGTGPLLGGLPVVTMSQNLLPFEPSEAARFGLASPMRLKQWAVGIAQAASFRRAQGVIFLTNYAMEVVLKRIGPIRAHTTIIPHGIEPRFFRPPKPMSHQWTAECGRSFRLLYVSVVDSYKHQWNVARAAATLSAKGIQVELEFVGSARPSALRRLRAVMSEVDPEGRFIRYSGPVPFSELHSKYDNADACVFASSCENLPNILLEGMAAGLPVASSDRGPMPEVLGDAGIYFDPLNPESIALAIERLMGDASLRDRLGRSAKEKATAYTWARCANETLKFCASFAD